MFVHECVCFVFSLVPEFVVRFFFFSRFTFVHFFPAGQILLWACCIRNMIIQLHSFVVWMHLSTLFSSLYTFRLESFCRRVCRCATVCIFANHVFSHFFTLLLLFFVSSFSFSIPFLGLLFIHWESVPNTISFRKSKKKCFSDDSGSPFWAVCVNVNWSGYSNIHVQLLINFTPVVASCLSLLLLWLIWPFRTYVQMQVKECFFSLYFVLFRFGHCVWLLI